MRYLRESSAIALILALGLLAPSAALGAGDRHRSRHSVPEFDPTAAGAVVALVVGGGVLLARRRK